MPASPARSRKPAAVGKPAAVESLGRPMSEVIRERIRRAGTRWHANDNIAAYIESPAELAALQAELEEKVQAVLRSLVIDVESDHNTEGTAHRIAKMYLKEVFAGRYSQMPPVTSFPNVERIDELILVGPITVRSACSHHFCPIMGRVWIGVMPHAESRLIGLSKYSRLTDWVMSRPQIQEEAVKNLADILEDAISPAGIALVMTADHYCMHWRGVKDQASMTSSVMRGVFLKSDALRKEFLSLVRTR